MAGREGQGLQIAVIIFAMLTIILAITTFIFYSQAQTAQKERDAAVQAKGNTDLENKKNLHKILALKLVLGHGGVTQDQVDAAKQSAGEDTEVTEIMNNFNADMAAYGAEAGAPGTTNYRTLP